MRPAHYRAVESLRNASTIIEAKEKILNGEEFSLSGWYGSAIPLLTDLVADSLQRPVFLLLQDEGDLERVTAELKIWTDSLEIHPFPFVHANITTLEHAALLQQMKGIRAMLEPQVENGLWVSTFDALEAPCFSLDFIDEPVLLFESGQNWKLDELGETLEKRGFNRQDRVDQKGDYTIRGGILDIFPRFSPNPYRLDFFGDELESIREFSAVTQRSLRKVQRFVLDDMDYERVQHIERNGNIMDYLPDNPVFFIQEPELVQKHSENKTSKSGLFQLLMEADPSERKKRGMARAFFARELEDSLLRFDTKTSEPLGLSLEEAIDYLKKPSEAPTRFLIESFGSSLKLAEKGRLDLWNLEGSLEDNFSIPGLGIEVYHEKNLVQISELQGDEIGSEPMGDFVDLEMGDYIVHENYGVGQFLGLTSMEKNGVMSDFLLLQFAGGSKVYVSVSQLNLVQKYIGRGESQPELSKIGAKSWEMKKKRARKAIDRIVMELVRQQAFRTSQPGYSFSPDTPEQRAFERAFPYNDTPCQSEASAAIKRAMEKVEPMDHLLCGDVGFGKTEVAMRMAHKAALDEKQVAILAPTTVLAEQHYNNFIKRFKGKEDWLGVLDRFKTAKQSREILLKVAAGEVRILIGTHRLLSKDLDFLDLGLLILDEEQRFGVKQKESIKKRYPNIDVLSLSATPIPRTLHLSMLGIRTISNLTIPPENRQPIRTYIRERQKGIIKHAIGRELERGGQSYFLHNRIEDIQQVKEELISYFPQARIGVGHGQMGEKELSEVMRAFFNLELDIFLSTSIVANGIDIPTANTMIVNDSHFFGLSELHQIRGRIGRYSIQAYCYLLIPGGAKLPPSSLRRLRAIEEHQDLGAGFKLAMKDMEIRGVGNLLGEDQHGQIADIGYELYTQYLSQAISEMKGESPESFWETELDWNLGSSYFPKSYIPSHTERIDFYRRISFAKTSNRLDQIQAELKDRYGALPKPTQQLLGLFFAKTRLREMGILSFKKKGDASNVLIETFNWEDDLKLNWVLSSPKALAFYGNSHILIKVDQVWNLCTDEKVEKDPYTTYSYYNEDNRIEPLEVLEVVLDYMAKSLRNARKNTAVDDKQENQGTSD